MVTWHDRFRKPLERIEREVSIGYCAPTPSAALDETHALAAYAALCGELRAHLSIIGMYARDLRAALDDAYAQELHYGTEADHV